MTDARIPERFLMDRRFMRLPADDFRSYVLSLLWSVSNRTDGHVEPEDLALIPGFIATSSVVLVEVNLWAMDGNGWNIVDFPETQTSRHDLEVLANARRADREKKARQRADRKTSGVYFAESPGDEPGDLSPGRTQDRQARTKSTSGDERRATDKPAAAQPSVSWPVVEIPNSTPSSPSSCAVSGCSNPLVSPESLALGVCRKGGAAHDKARSSAAA